MCRVHTALTSLTVRRNPGPGSAHAMHNRRRSGYTSRPRSSIPNDRGQRCVIPLSDRWLRYSPPMAGSWCCLCGPARFRRVITIWSRQAPFGSTARCVQPPWTSTTGWYSRVARSPATPNIRTDLRNSGASVLDRELAIDHNLITSRPLDDLPVLCRPSSTTCPLRASSTDSPGVARHRRIQRLPAAFLSLGGRPIQWQTCVDHVRLTPAVV